MEYHYPRRHYAAHVENAQVAVYLTYSGLEGHAAIDRELYLPVSWTEDRARCRAAGIPEQITFATKPALATRMIVRALDAQVPASWVAADEVDGADPHLRRVLEDRKIGYVLAVACDHRIPTSAGDVRADVGAARLPEHAWRRLSAGAGAKGQRW